MPECLPTFFPATRKEHAINRFLASNHAQEEAPQDPEAQLRLHAGTRAQGDHADLHQLAVEWQESAADYGFPTRRWSAQSLFALPRLLKAAGRCGLHNAVDVDQENCHFHAQLARHPGRAALVQYVRERDAKLQEVQTTLKVGRGDAKQLFLVICYHGCVEKWCRARGLARDALPPFVAEFADEQALILQEDARQHPDILAEIKASGAERPEVTLQSHLNMKHERLVLDAMAAAARGLAEVGSYEHDGLWLYTREVAAGDAAAGEAWRQRLLRRIQAAVSVPVSIKSPPTLEEVFKQLKQRWPAEDWDTEEQIDEAQAALVAQALPNCEKGREHSLYAQIVAMEARAWSDLPYSVKQVFKHLHSGTYAHWDRQTQRWTQEHARDLLLHAIGDVLRRRLTPWGMEPAWSDSGKRVFHMRYETTPESLHQVCVVESTEKLLRPLLRDPGFKLDHQRHLLLFSNCAYDRDRGEWLPITPEVRSSRCTDWAWEGSGLSAEQEAAIRDAFHEIGVDESTLPSEKADRLAAIAEFLKPLAFINGICGSWERVVYLLKFLARALFALPMQECLWTRGPGSNGKDTLANLMMCLLGEYFANLPCEALTGGREMDAPSQTILALRGRRFAAVREIARNAKIRSHIYKTISDPKGKLKARGLYGKDEEFEPQFLLYLASNVPVDIDDSSGGSARRTRILDLPFNFVEEPRDANERQRNSELEQLFPGWRPSFFFLLLQVFTRFLKDRPQSNITPVPVEVLDAVEEELEEEWMQQLATFVQTCLRPAASARDATSAAEVRQAFFDSCAGSVPKKEVGLRLARKGFAEESANFWVGVARTKRRVYRLNFPDSAGAYVALQARPGSTGGS